MLFLFFRDTQNGILENQVQSVAQDLQLAQYIAHEVCLECLDMSNADWLITEVFKYNNGSQFIASHCHDHLLP